MSNYPGQQYQQRQQQQRPPPPPPIPTRSISAFPSRAYPPPPPSTTRPPPPPQSWQPGQSFYFGGSAAPAISSQRNQSSPRAAFGTPSQQQRAPPQPGWTTDGACCCCGTTVAYPRGVQGFHCTVCSTINDLKAVGAGSEPPVYSAVISAGDVQALHRQLVSSSGGGSLETGLEALALGASEDPDVEDLFVRKVAAAFKTIPTIEALFRDPSNAISSLETLSTFYDLVRSRPRAMDAVRSAVEGFLRKPGTALREGDGGWLVVLFECPILLSSGTPDPQQRAWILSRVLGLISNLPNGLHHALVQHLSSPSYPTSALQAKVELVTAYISNRIGGSMGAVSDGAYADDWGVKTGSRVAALLFASNQQRPRLELAAFYSTIIDSLGPAEMISSFTTWEARSGRFSLCQYPFLLSLGIKIHLLSYDGTRQMEEKAREAIRSTIYYRQLVNPVLILQVRRTQLVHDSLRQISQHSSELKKRLRITFDGEDGVDAGGLRKEWFLLLCRQLFDSQFGMFVFDEDSHLCWFNPASLESFDEFYLVGAVIGLAIYNSVTLDVPLPLAVYKKLAHEPVGLADLAVVRPALARGLQALLDYSGDDVEDVFCRSFVGDYEAWGEVQEVPLIEGGASVPVTNANRAEYVKLYVSFLLDAGIRGQYESFARGFMDVTSGNALSLFRGEELELLVRGSTEPLDIEQLKGMTVYEGFAGEEDPTVQLFWEVFSGFDVERQRALLSFITGSDRIPATGTSALQLKLTNLGPDTGRWPTSHTCFNQLCLYRYRDRRAMEDRLTSAMDESEGFGLK